MTNITWKLNVSIAGGPSQSLSQALAVEAYDKVVLELIDGAPETTVEIGAATAEVLFMLVTASHYGSGLVYKINATGNPPHVLDRPLQLAGSGAVGLLGFPPTALLFTNTLGANADIEILIGRDATP